MSQYSKDVTNLVQFIQSKAELLASRYNNAQDYDDLLQEGVLMGLELLESGVDDPKRIVGAMRKRMNDYHNFSNKTVAVPASGRNYKARSDLSKGVTTEDVPWPLLQALTQSQGVSLEDYALVTDKDHVEEYEAQEYLQHVMFLLEEVLDNRTYDVVMSVYVLGVTQEEVADQLNISQQRVQQIIDRGLEKVQKEITKDAY